MCLLLSVLHEKTPIEGYAGRGGPVPTRQGGTACAKGLGNRRGDLSGDEFHIRFVRLRQEATKEGTAGMGVCGRNETIGGWNAAEAPRFLPRSFHDRFRNDNGVHLDQGDLGPIIQRSGANIKIIMNAQRKASFKKARDILAGHGRDTGGGKTSIHCIHGEFLVTILLHVLKHTHQPFTK